MPNPPSKMAGDSSIFHIFTKKHEVVLFSSTVITLYEDDQGTSGLCHIIHMFDHANIKKSPIIGIIVSAYYLGCAVGAVIASWLADKEGRKPSIFTCLITTSLGNILMFISGLSMHGFSPWKGRALACMLTGRVALGLGYSSELSSDGARGRALAQEFQMNIFGLLIAYGISLGVTRGLKESRWAWRIPIMVMQLFPILLVSFISRLPESPRYFMSKEQKYEAQKALEEVWSKKDANGSQFHPSMVTVMGQINQAFTGCGAVSVYGPQIFQLLGFDTWEAEYLTLGNYILYSLMMASAWLSMNIVGRRKLMVWGAAGLAICFAILTGFGGIAQGLPDVPDLAVEIPGSVTLFVATTTFCIGWLATVWLIPTEIYSSTARAQGSAISGIIWGLANFAITLLTPIGFNSLKYWLFLVFAVTNIFAGWWTWKYTPESGGRSFEESQEFFNSAKEDGSWSVKRVDGGKFEKMPGDNNEEEEDCEQLPLLRQKR
ncbi:general substrate transporter [Hyaloscypha bicolor E]|uniref:General substrate transporter n=1 Tax=Hyaloscypha bicolor E TaxID=1095630 RepID=A0A2J6T2J9_9HELO|nr:general substrate transporter [Hyaloscypha bicolor E]PMD57163.1 general substrate transporter [Hyaloscypha bicolor E]